jgi:hypothetical protein
MHQIFATFFSLLIALCHHTSLTARPVEAAEIMAPVTSSSTSPAMILPDRYQLARASNGYAETACVSCRRMDGSSSDR